MPHSSHDSRASFLDVIATMLGFEQPVGGELADGRRPDVLRINADGRGLFIGDAKDTEHPTDRKTRARLSGYLRWLRVHRQNNYGPSMFAVCFGRAEDTGSWTATCLSLAADLELKFRDHGLRRFDRSLWVVWFLA